MRIVDFVRPGGIVFLKGSSGHAVLHELGGALATHSALPLADVVSALLYREHVCSTAIGHGIAIPHIRNQVDDTTGVLGLAPPGIDFRAPDGLPVQIFVAFVSRPKSGKQLEALAAVARDLVSPALRKQLVDATAADAVYALLASAPRGR